MSGRKIVPCLRFPGFTKEWQRKKLGDIAKLTSSKRVYLSGYVNHGIPFYRGKEITELKQGKQPKDILYISDETYATFKNRFGAPREGEILITAVGTLGNVWLVNSSRPFYFKDGNLIWLKDISIHSKFLEILLETQKRKILASSIGSSQQALTIVRLNKVCLAIPEVDEQIRIAGLLTIVDERIMMLNNKVELLKQYKKGVMQEIFTRQARFKSEPGNSYPEWKTCNFSEIYTFVRTNSLSRDDLDTDTTHGLKNIHYGDIHTYLPAQVDITKVPLPVIKNRFRPKHEDEYCRVGDVIIADASEDYVDIGKCVELIKLGDEKVVAGLHTFLARPKPDKVALGFSSYVLRSGTVRKQVMRIATGVSVLGVSKSNLSKVIIPLPSLEEQKKITGFLMTIDDKVNIPAAETAGHSAAGLPLTTW